MTASPAPDKLLSARIRTLHRAAAGVLRGDARSIHLARTTTRRLREALPSVPLSSRRVAPILRRLRKVGRRLGAIRDVDVQLRHVNALLRWQGGSDGVLVVLRDDLQRERRSCDTLRLGARVTRVATRLARLQSRLAASDSAAQRRAFTRRARDRASRRATRLATAMVSAGTLYASDRLHAVRIAAKQLRYAIEPMEGTVAMTRMLQLLRSVQTVLGAEHDTAVLLGRLRRMRGASAELVACPATLEAFLEARCRRLHARFLLRRQALRAICTDLVQRHHLPAPQVRGATR